MSEWAYVRPQTKVQAVKENFLRTGQNMFAVVDNDVYQGYIRLKDIEEYPQAETAKELLDFVRKFADRNIFVYTKDPVDEAKEKIKQNKLQFIPVIDYIHHYQGTLDRSSTG